MTAWHNTAAYRLLVESHIWTALVVTSLSHYASRKLALPVNHRALITVFLATVAIYSIDRIFDLRSIQQQAPSSPHSRARDTELSGCLRRAVVRGSVAIAGLLGILLESPVRALLLVAIGTGACSLYGAPILRRRLTTSNVSTDTVSPRRIKDIPGIKGWLVGSAVAVAALGVPLAHSPSESGPITAIMMLLVATTAVNAHLFDLRDLDADRRQGLRTLPVIIGQGRTRSGLSFFAVVLCLAAALLPAIIPGFMPHGGSLLPESIVMAFALLTVLWTVNALSPRWHFGLFVDGLLVIPLTISLMT